MLDAAGVTAVIAILGTAVVYGTDVFCAMVQRPAVAAIDDRALVAVMGNVHRQKSCVTTTLAKAIWARLDSFLHKLGTRSQRQ